ncbi:MAG: hypothetical protein P9L94_10340 [Candidatus Hinthialibacter antarcticus]|nr:hypothetical protein [Candidatus Hinthialibacter antarcticus]
MNIQAFSKRVALSLFTGCIFYALAEAVFWGRFDSIGQFGSQFIPTLVLYSLAAYVFLWTVQSFRVHEWAGVVLAAALYGWFIEGLVVQTMYDDLPLSIVITGLSWHALIVVYEGWYITRRRLREKRLFPLLSHAVVFGLFWGLWSVWWWIETGEITPLPQYCIYAAITSLLFIGGLLGSNWIQPGAFPPPRTEGGLVLAICVIYFCFVTVPANIHALWVFPLCVGITLWALNRNRRNPKSSLDEQIYSKPSLMQLLCLLAMPAAAIGVYALLLLNNQRIATGPTIYIASALGGAVLFIAALYKAFWGSRNRVEGEV